MKWLQQVWKDLCYLKPEPQSDKNFRFIYHLLVLYAIYFFGQKYWFPVSPTIHMTYGEDWVEFAWHSGHSSERSVPSCIKDNNMTEETISSLAQEHQADLEGTGSDAELERGGKQAKFEEEDSDNDSTVSSSNSNSTQVASGKRGFRGKGRKKKSLAFRCVNFLKVT